MPTEKQPNPRKEDQPKERPPSPDKKTWPEVIEPPEVPNIPDYDPPWFVAKEYA